MDLMTPRQRVLHALSFEEADSVPYHLMIDEAIRPALAHYFGDERFEQRITNHLPFYNLEAAITWIDQNVYEDVFGCVWRKLNVPHLERCRLPEPSLAGYTFPDLTEQVDSAEVERFLAAHNQHFRLCGIAHGFFDRGWALRGMENFLADFILHPAFVEEFFEAMTGRYLALIDHIAVYPFDGIRFGDDWGYQRGVMIGERRWRKFIKPGLKRICEHARSKGLVVMVHSDGDVSALVPDLIEIGVSILNPIQPEVMDILKLKRLYGKDLCFNGGVSTQLTLPMGSPADVRQEVLACIRYLGKGGGYVLSPAKAILEDVPLENAAALIDAMVNQPEMSHHSEPLPEQVEELWRVYAAFHPDKMAV